jgi:hypothetical protein
MAKGDFMDREKLIKIGTIALILFFVLEIVYMYFSSNPYANNNLTPTPSPIPSAEPTRFEGFNSTEAYVISIGNELLMLCNTTQDLDLIVGKVIGVIGVSYDPQTTRVGVAVAQNASMSDVIKALKATLKPLCTPLIYKRAYLKVPDVINFTDANGNETKIIFGDQLQCLQAPSFAQCFAFVQPDTQENATAEMVIYARLLGDSVEFISAEEPRKSQPLEFRNAKASAIVSLQLPQLIASAQIPWEGRLKINATSINQTLGSKLNFSEVKYTLGEQVYVNSTDNATFQKIQNLSYVAIAYLEDQIRIVPKSNYSNKNQIESDLEGFGLMPSQIKFDTSTLTIDFEQTNTSEKIVLDAIKPIKPKIQQLVIADLLDVPSIEKEFGETLPRTKLKLYVTNSTINSTFEVNLAAMLQDGNFAYFDGTESSG